MKRICFVLLICVALLCVFLTPCFAAAETTAAQPIDWVSPSVDSGYIYHTRSGEYWYYDLPASPVVAPVTFHLSNSGGLSNYTVTLLEGDTYQVVTSSGRTVLKVTRASNGSVFYENIRSSEYSRSMTYFTTTSTVSSYHGDTLQGAVYTSGGGLVSSGVSSAAQVFSSIVNYVFTDTVILVVIGLAVGVTLIGWGIGKVKSTVKGY